MMFTAPPFLKPGDAVGLAAVARPVVPDELAEFRQVAQARGFRVIESPHLYERLGRLAGTPRQRAEGLHQLWHHPEIKAIFCARGGCGSAQMYPELERLPWAPEPKWLVGFSDATWLLHWVLTRHRCMALHGPMAINWGPRPVDPTCLSQVWQVLTGQWMPVYRWALPPAPRRVGHTQGHLAGGNLSLVQTLLGTPLAAVMAGSILMLEDVDEAPHRYDRALHHLAQTGLWAQLKGLVMGNVDMAADDEATPWHETPGQALAGVLAPYPDLVTAAGAPLGHGRLNSPLILGAPTELMVNDQQALLRQLPVV